MTKPSKLEKSLGKEWKNLSVKPEESSSYNGRLNDHEKELEEMKNSYVPHDSSVQTHSQPTPKAKKSISLDFDVKKMFEEKNIDLKKIVGYGLYVAATAGIIFTNNYPIFPILGAITGEVGLGISHAYSGGYLLKYSPAKIYINAALFGAGASQIVEYIAQVGNNDMLEGLIAGGLFGLLAGLFTDNFEPITDYFFEKK